MKFWRKAVASLLALSISMSCATPAAALKSSDGGAVPLAVSAPTASGKKEQKNSKAVIDYSNTADGYVMVQYTASTSNRLKVQVTRNTTYTYDLPVGKWVTFPLSEGNGSYKVNLYEQNPASGKYAAVVSATFDVTLSNEQAPFLWSNQYVDYEKAEKTIAKAKEVVGEETDTLNQVKLIYEFVVKNLSYDKDRANDVISGKLKSYLPVLDSVLEAKKGICFDYAALMAGMLRSLGVPCKLVVGFVGDGVYHAWISVWTEESGWVDSVIYFDGITWHRMDPTFASTSNNSESIMKFIGNGENYKDKYIY